MGVLPPALEDVNSEDERVSCGRPSRVACKGHLLPQWHAALPPAPHRASASSSPSSVVVPVAPQQLRGRGVEGESRSVFRLPLPLYRPPTYGAQPRGTSWSGLGLFHACPSVRLVRCPPPLPSPSDAFRPSLASVTLNSVMGRGKLCPLPRRAPAQGKLQLVSLL